MSRHEPLLQLVLRIAMVWVDLGRPLEAALPFGYQTGLAHESHDAVAATVDALLPQRVQNLGTAVGLPTLLMHLGI